MEIRPTRAIPAGPVMNRRILWAIPTQGVVQEEHIYTLKPAGSIPVPSKRQRSGHSAIYAPTGSRRSGTGMRISRFSGDSPLVERDGNLSSAPKLLIPSTRSFLGLRTVTLAIVEVSEKSQAPLILHECFSSA